MHAGKLCLNENLGRNLRGLFGRRLMLRQVTDNRLDFEPLCSGQAVVVLVVG